MVSFAAVGIGAIDLGIGNVLGSNLFNLLILGLDDGVGGRLTEKEIRLRIVAPKEMNPAVAKRGYQLSEEDLNALVAYPRASSRP